MNTYTYVRDVPRCTHTFPFDTPTQHATYIRMYVCIVHTYVYTSGIRYSYFTWGTISQRLFKVAPTKYKHMYYVLHLHIPGGRIHYKQRSREVSTEGNVQYQVCSCDLSCENL